MHHLKNKSIRKLIGQYRSADYTFQNLPDEEYLSYLHKHLTDLPDSEINFFVNRKRFRLMQALIGAELSENVKTILNVASGPFAFENYVRKRGDVNIDSFDFNPLLEGLFKDLKSTEKFPNLTYETASAESYSTDKTYDLVLINDLFYHNAVDFYELIGRYAERVKPDGLLYFDILDIRSKWFWAALGKDGQFIRYELKKVALELEKHGLVLRSVTPSLGIGGIADFTIRAVLYRTLRLANNYIFVAQKK